MTDYFLFEICQVALGNTNSLSRSFNEVEWDCLYDAAAKQSLIGICSIGIQKLPKEQLPAMEMVMQWIGQTERIRSRNEQMNRYCLKLQNRLENDGLQYCVLKGQGVASYYGDLSLYRQSGDIDVWISGGFDKVVGFVNKISLTDKVQDRHIELDFFDDAEVEAHFFPINFANIFVNRRLKKWIDNQEQTQMKNIILFGSDTLHAPTIEFNLVYLLLHIYKHLFGEGIGLRQLMDYYFALNVADIDDGTKKRIKDVISSFGLEYFAEGIMWVLQEVFGMNLSLALWTPNEKYGRFLLSEIMQMGNFGHQDERFKLEKDGSHFMRYLQMIQSKVRFLRYYPSEVFWQPIGIFIRFFKIRWFRKKVRLIANNQIYNGRDSHSTI